MHIWEISEYGHQEEEKMVMNKEWVLQCGTYSLISQVILKIYNILSALQEHTVKLEKDVNFPTTESYRENSSDGNEVREKLEVKTKKTIGSHWKASWVI